MEESEVVELTSAEERFESLKPAFGERIGLIHGRMNGAEKTRPCEHSNKAKHGFSSRLP